MRALTMLSAGMCLGLAACGGTEPGQTAAEEARVTGQPAGVPWGMPDVCVPVSRCEPDRMLFCQKASGACYLLLLDPQRTVPVRCSLRPQPPPGGSAHQCP